MEIPKNVAANIINATKNRPVGEHIENLRAMIKMFEESIDLQTKNLKEYKELVMLLNEEFRSLSPVSRRENGHKPLNPNISNSSAIKELQLPKRVYVCPSYPATTYEVFIPCATGSPMPNLASTDIRIGTAHTVPVPSVTERSEKASMANEAFAIAENPRIMTPREKFMLEYFHRTGSICHLVAIDCLYYLNNNQNHSFTFELECSDRDKSKIPPVILPIALNGNCYLSFQAQQSNMVRIKLRNRLRKTKLDCYGFFDDDQCVEYLTKLLIDTDNIFLTIREGEKFIGEFFDVPSLKHYITKSIV